MRELQERKRYIMNETKYDILIKSCTVVDGTGSPGYKADVAVKSGKIAAIQPGLPEDSASSVIDAGGKIVCPGFIDAHCHTDWAILDGPWDDHQERQGVTTQIGGLCGTSPVSIREHLEQAHKQGLGTNYALFAGHGSIRYEVMGDENRKPTSEELDQMKALLKTAMDEGALGLSTGLIYKPGVFSDTEELIEMAKVIAPMGGIYATHMRSESDDIEKALDEAITVARTAGTPLQISHIKVIMPRNWGFATKMLDRIRQEQSRGLKITADQYPYAVTGGGHYGAARLVEDYDRETGFDMFEEQYQDIEKRNEMAEYASALIAERGGPEYFSIIKASQDKFIGMYLHDALAQQASLNLGEFIVHEIHESKGQFAMVYHSVSEEELAQFMQQPWVMGGTDGVPGAFHPRTHGTFPRILGRYVREKQVLSLEEAIRKITSLPADTLGLEGRGRLTPGAMADIVVFDPDTVIDRSNMVQPTLYPDGIDHVLINGVPVIEKGERTGAFPGKVLLRK